MAYVQYVYHFQGRDSIDVRDHSYKHIEALAKDYNNIIKSLSYQRIMSNTHSWDFKTTEKMLKEHYPELLV